MGARRLSRASLVHALSITALYVTVGVAWILGSDYLADLIAEGTQSVAAIQRYKGIVYVLVTGAGLLVLIMNALRRVQTFHLRLDDSIRRSEELGVYLNAIIRSAPVAVFDLTETTVVRSLWNPAAERLFGWTAAEAIGTRPELISTEAWAQVLESREAVKAGEAVTLVEVKLRRKDGSTFQGAVSAAGVDHGDDRVTIVIVSDITKLHRTLSRLEASLAEREVLLREIHHRVKNSLQIVSSLLMLERREPGVGEHEMVALDRALSRIRSIARVHEMLYHGPDLAEIDLADYLRTLSGDIVGTFDPTHRIDLRVDLCSTSVHVEQAVPIGLVFHELLVNAYKHAFPELDGGRIDVRVTCSPSHLVLDVRDNGIGFPPEATDDEPQRGLMLVRVLASQINADLATGNADGASVSLTVPLDAVANAPVTD